MQRNAAKNCELKRNAEKFREMQRNGEKCREMQRYAEKCREMQRNASIWSPNPSLIRINFRVFSILCVFVGLPEIIWKADSKKETNLAN